MHQQPDAAEEDQQRTAGGGAPRLAAGPISRCGVKQGEGRGDESAARQARRGVEFDEVAEQLARSQSHGEREPVIERLVVQPGHAGDARHDDVAADRHAVHDAQADRVLRLPQIVAREAGQDERRDDGRKGRGRRWERKPGQHSPGSYLVFLV